MKMYACMASEDIHLSLYKQKINYNSARAPTKIICITSLNAANLAHKPISAHQQGSTLSLNRCMDA